MANRTNASTPLYSYEYYLDYLDLLPVDEDKLGAHKHSVTIAFWVSLVMFVVLLFLVLLSMSWAGSPQARNNAQRCPTCPWSLRLALPLCVQRYLLLHRAPQRSPQPPPSSARESDGEAHGPHQQLQQQQSPSASKPMAPQAPPAHLWEQALSGNPHVLS